MSVTDAIDKAKIDAAERVCRCGASFTPRTHNQRYCSLECRDNEADDRRRQRDAAVVCCECGAPATTGRCVACATKRGPESPEWRGGEYLHASSGRWYIYRNGRYTQRARAVMEAHLGRSLETREQVHHINGDQADDRVENLRVLDIADHARLHHLGKPKPRRGRARA